ncbi:DUF3995 domain-containing protein [Paenibacillus terrigena]|uniref:DUF3995 domain-containing protein n=1 Tax=Paenibacillus terrigena TaxID=369333 RepID=UPI0028D487A5|nr:DUF3995 domain-containing protein [Paenibacillus terrigena]
MVEMVAWVVSGILLVLSGLHFYWAFGGKRGNSAVIPTNGSEKLFQPSPIGTSMVGLLLALAAWIALEWSSVIKPLLFSDLLLLVGGWVVAAVFIIRGIGDFKWVGLFKRKKGTAFAKWDSMLYSPLCLFLGISYMLIGTLR